MGLSWYHELYQGGSYQSDDGCSHLLGLLSSLAVHVCHHEESDGPSETAR